MAQHRAILCGYYGKGNGGDEALLATLLQMLPDSVLPIVLSGNPAQTQKQYGVTAIDRSSTQAVWQALRQSDAFIWGGGSLMQDSTSALSPLYYAGLMGLAQRLGRVTIAWAQGIGPLNRSFTRWLTHTAYAGCTAVSVRDRGSAALLQDWQIVGSMAPDPVWALTATPVTSLWQSAAPRVAVALRPHPSLAPERLALLTQALIDFQAATQTCIVLVPFQPIQDLAIAQAIQSQLPGESQIIQLADPRQLKGIFREVDMTISMRYHGLIMAAAEGCRCFALSYDPKVRQLMDELHLPGWDLTAADATAMPTDAKSLTQAWLNTYQQPAVPSEQVDALIKAAFNHQALLHTTLGNLAKS